MAQHVAFFLPDMRGGGAEKSSMLLANEMVRRGVRVDVVLMRAEGPWLSDLSSDTTIIDLGAKRFAKSIVPFAQYLRTHRPAIVYSQMFETAIFAAMAIKLSGHRPKFVSTIRYATSQCYQNVGAKPLVAAFLGKWIHRLSVDDIVAISVGVADDFSSFAKIARDRITVIYNPVDPAIRSKAREPVPHPWFQSGQPPVFLGVGSLKQEKGFDTLVRAFAILRSAHNARLVILGEGSFRRPLEELAATLGVADDVSLPGFVSNPFPYMARSAAFVLSSRGEGWGNVLAEALALDVNCIAMDCPSGPRELLEDGRRGRLVPVDDVQALTQAMSDRLVFNDS